MRSVYPWGQIRLLLVASLCCVVGLTSTSAEVGAASTGMKAELGAGAGHSRVAGDHFATLSATAAIVAGDVAVDLVAPLRYGATGVRALDWDEASEWLRPLRRLEFRRSGDQVYGRVGRLSGATLGHGTLVLGYHNTIAPDHGKAGLRVDVDLGRWGGQLFINDVVTWEVLAGRAYLRPLDGSDSRLLRSLTVGGTFAADLKAPLRASTDADGGQVFDQHGVLQAERDLLTLYGVDVGLEAWRSSTLALVPYIDLNLMPRPAGAVGWGVHSGLYLHLRPRDRVFEMILRYDARYESGPYEAAWFDAMYEVERFQYHRPGAAGHRTKLAWPRELSGGGHRLGHMIEGEVRIRESFRLTARYERLTHGAGWRGRDSAMLAINLPPTREVELDAFVALRPAPEERWYVVAAAALRWRFWRPLHAFVDYHRAWHVRDGVAPILDVTDDWSWGLGVRSTF